MRFLVPFTHFVKYLFKSVASFHWTVGLTIYQSPGSDTRITMFPVTCSFAVSLSLFIVYVTGPPPKGDVTLQPGLWGSPFLPGAVGFCPADVEAPLRDVPRSGLFRLPNRGSGPDAMSPLSLVTLLALKNCLNTATAASLTLLHAQCLGGEGAPLWAAPSGSRFPAPSNA